VEDDKYDNELIDYIKQLQNLNILKEKIYGINNRRVVECDFTKSKREQEYYCEIYRHFDILLYTDIIIPLNENLYLEEAYIEIGGKKMYSTKDSIKIIDYKEKTIYRLCWNINTLDSKSNHDKNMLWIPMVQLKMHVVQLTIKLFSSMKCSLRIIGMNCEQLSTYDNNKYTLIRPNVMWNRNYYNYQGYNSTFNVYKANGGSSC
jgi:hypothetical protein